MNLHFPDEIPFSNPVRIFRFQLARKRTLLFSLALCLLAASGLLAQPAIEWDRTYDPGSFFKPSVVGATDDGGIIVGQSVNSTESNYVVAKYNIAGDKEWDQIFGGERRDVLTAIIQTTDGGYLLGGTSGSNKSPDKSENSYSGADYWVVKISASGTRQWDKTFGGSDIDNLSSLKQTTDGGYILGGNSRSPKNAVKSENSRGEYDYWVIKITSNGTKEWDKTIGGAGSDFFVYIDQTASGNYILGGYTYSPVSGDKTAAIKGNEDY